MPGNNTIEVTAQYIDEVSKGLGGTERAVEQFGNKLFEVGTKLAEAFAIEKTLEKVVDETSAAQRVVTQLGIAYQNSAESINRSKKEITEFSESQTQATEFSTNALTKAQTALLRYDRVQGDVFDRARKDALDVASALGKDLVDASETLGRALERPSTGLRQLRSLNIVFSQSEQELIARMEKTGRAAEAQGIILDKLEGKYQGSAAAARDTLGGAISGLKNAFEDLFVSTEKGAESGARAVNQITEIISSPGFKTSIQGFTAELLDWTRAFVNVVNTAIYGLKNLAQYAAHFSESAEKTGLDKLFAKQSNLGASLDAALPGLNSLSSVERRRSEVLIARIRKDLDEVRDQIKSAKEGVQPGEAQPIGSRQVTKPGQVKFVSDDELARQTEDARNKVLDSLEPINIAIQKIEDQGLAKVMKEFGEEAETAGDKLNRSFERTKIILNEVGASEEQYKKKIEEVIDSELQLIDLNQIRSRKLVEPLSAEQVKINKIVDTVEEGLKNLAQSGQTAGRAILRYLLAAFESKLVFTAIDKLGVYLRKSLSTSGSGGGTAGFIGGLLGAFFGAAGGGDTMGLEWVGESGPELRSGRSKVWNTQQLRAAGIGGGRAVQVSFGDTNFNIAGNADQKTLQIMRSEQERNNKKQLEAFSNIMRQNDYRPLR